MSCLIKKARLLKHDFPVHCNCSEAPRSQRFVQKDFKNEGCRSQIIYSGTDMTGRPGYRTMEMIGGSSASYLARTPRVPLFSTLFNRGGNRRAFRLPGAGGDHCQCTVEPSNIRNSTKAITRNLQEKSTCNDFLVRFVLVAVSRGCCSGFLSIFVFFLLLHFALLDTSSPMSFSCFRFTWHALWYVVI